MQPIIKKANIVYWTLEKKFHKLLNEKDRFILSYGSEEQMFTKD